jgi:hemin uptake protein HemP
MRVDTGFESHRTSASRTSSGALLQGARELIIEHAGREYRLRVTASGKLILTA